MELVIREDLHHHAVTEATVADRFFTEVAPATFVTTISSKTVASSFSVALMMLELPAVY